MLPLLIIIAELLVLTINLINVFVNKFKIGLKLALSTTLVYFSTVGYLVYYCISYNVAAGDGWIFIYNIYFWTENTFI